MDIKAKVAALLFDFDSLNEEAQQELNNGKDEQENELQQTDEQIPTDPTA